MVASFVLSVIQWLVGRPHIAYTARCPACALRVHPDHWRGCSGHGAILVLSALVPSGVLVLWPLLAAAILGAIFGDGLSFWLGHRYHRQILAIWPLNRYPELIERSEAFIVKFCTSPALAALSIHFDWTESTFGEHSI
ncbi:hypothetical protein ASE23_27945 [Rhizobium sp. Root73]|uniref:DedA family protein n=1 Tax=unclassified Rhizobium TaxID=2613769 RepID=UPI0007269FA3|nr:MULTISPECIES: hypothetical protein [unclassified Rhizobium]KQY12464.1 hypothetical protein ASD36_27895 [Rhizobium sp. Root1334]KRC04478.1 hypothetical protein ASE23_27945 [Rhizobium sp. Root73]